MCIGLGTATKYFALLLVPSLLAAHALSSEAPLRLARGWPRVLGCWASPKVILASGATILAFFIGSPFNLLDFGIFVSDYQKQLLSSGVGQGGVSGWYLTSVLPASLGWPLYLLSLLGIVLLAVQRIRLFVPLITFPVLYFSVISRGGVGFPRYMIPIELLLCLFAAYALSCMWSSIRRRAQSRYAVRLRLGMLVSIVAIVTPPFVSTLRWDAVMAREIDPRTAALAWMSDAVAPGSVVAVQPVYDRTFFNIPVTTDRTIAKVAKDIPQGRRFDAVRQRVVMELQRRTVYREVPFVYDFDALERSGARYILISSQNWPQMERGSAAPESPEMRFKQDLDAKATPLACFESAGQLDEPGPYPVVPPRIRIYQVSSAGDGGPGSLPVQCGGR